MKLTDYVHETFGSKWQTRNGLVIPEPEALNASNDAIEFDEATVLYADLSGSTAMVDTQEPDFAAEIYKNFLFCAAKLIEEFGGKITAYDGDRVMGMFIGAAQSSPAATCALKLNYAAEFIMKPAIKYHYPLSDFVLSHVVGIDISPIRVAKTGVRGETDLVWVGRAANYAAKLTELRSVYSTWITAAVYERLWDDAKYGELPGQLMWTKHSWEQMNNMEVYGSSWWYRI